MALTTQTPTANHAGVANYVEQIKQRRSIRKLTDGPITDETIRHILEAGRWSPSSFNSQPVRMVVVRERHAELWDFIGATLAAKLSGEQLARATSRLPGYKAGLFDIVFYEDTTVAANPPPNADAETWKSFAVQAMGIAQANVWNAIAAAGLAASNQHTNLQMEGELRGFLGVPETWKSYSIFPVGFAAEEPAEGTRKPAEDVIFFEHGPDSAGA